MPRIQHKSGAALRFERQRREATAALAAQAAQVRGLREVEHPPVAERGGAEPVTGILVTEQDQGLKAATPEKSPVVESTTKTAQNMPEIMPAALHEPGRWPLLALRAGQCRFACTPHTAQRDQHLFCGEPVAWLHGKPTSWCRVHLAVISGAPGRHAGGASVADVEAGRANDRDAQPARSGWGSTGA